jgi:hypothetical protein
MYVAAPHRVDEAAAFDIAGRARLGLLITTGPGGPVRQPRALSWSTPCGAP